MKMPPASGRLVSTDVAPKNSRRHSLHGESSATAAQLAGTTTPAPTAGYEERRISEFFDKWHSLAKDGGGWIISPPGSNPITIEAVKDSLLDRTMRTAGYNVMGMGSRIVPGAIKENIAQNRYMPERIVTHAGEVSTVLFQIALPKG
jgi:hypothetical protein